MSDCERVDAAARAAACADLLALGRPLGRASAALALFALAVLLLGREIPALPLWASLLLALPAQYHALRVAYDERVFRRWSGHWLHDPAAAPADTMAAFDRALGLAPAGRSLADRGRGARRLLQRQLIATVLQLACLVAAALYIRWPY